MDDTLARGYCQLQSDTPKLESRSFPSGSKECFIPPLDRYHCVYLSFFLCGTGFLLPYNSFITAVDYYKNRYPNSTIIFDMSLVYICSAFIGVLSNNLMIEMFSLQTRVTFGYIISFTTLLWIAIFDIWYQMFELNPSYYITLCSISAVALGCTVQQSSFYGYASMLPKRYTHALMTGESAAGLLVSINRILTKYLSSNSRVNTMMFFCLSLVIVVCCFVAFRYTRESNIVRFYVNTCEVTKGKGKQIGFSNPNYTNPEEVSLVDILEGNVTRDGYGVLVIQTPTSPSEDKNFPLPPSGMVENGVYTTSPGSIRQNQDEYMSYFGNYSQTTKTKLPLVNAIKRGFILRWRAAKSIWPYMMSIALAYFVTLCLFPGIESEIVSCKLKSWMPIILMFAFNFFDFIGKIIASIPYDWSKCHLVSATMFRIVLVPLLMLCASPRYSPYLKGEAWSLILSSFLGISNGYFGSVPMIIAPTKVPEEQKELTGNIMTLSYSIGLTFGSIVAYSLESVLGPQLLIDPCATPTISNMTTLDYFNTSTLHPNISYFENTTQYLTTNKMLYISSTF